MSQALADLLIVNFKKKKKSYQHITRHIVNIGTTNYYMIKQTNNCKELYEKPQQRISWLNHCQKTFSHCLLSTYSTYQMKSLAKKLI